jgi:hypothetical protein
VTNEHLEAHLRRIGYVVEQLTGNDGAPYIVIRDYQVMRGSLAGRTCDVAIQRSPSVPYVAPPAIHTRPALVSMDMTNPLRTQQSPIGPEWQYWSRVLRGQPTPAAIVAHVATIFSEV